MKNLLAGLMFSTAMLVPALAQNYPTNNPTYIPTVIGAPKTLSAPGAIGILTHNLGTLVAKVSGTNTGLVGTFQVTSDPVGTGSPVWKDVDVSLVGGVGFATKRVTADGVYRLNAAGFAQVQFKVTALSTGSVSAAFSGTPAVQLPAALQTYSAAALIGTGATSHFLVIQGSATTTVRVNRVACSGKATAAIAVNITAEMNSAADTGDAGTAATVVPHDSADAAATAVVLTHTTSPTPGALVGLVRAGTLSLANASTPVYNPDELSWTFGPQEIVLHGVAQEFALNSSAAFGTGAAVGCYVDITEE